MSEPNHPAPDDAPPNLTTPTQESTAQYTPSRRSNDSPTTATAANPTAALPPSIASVRNTKQFLASMNKMPLFMTQLDETGEDGGENMQLEALKALAYEGEPFEVAGNFRSQGNDCYRARQWKDAVEFYTKALAARCGVPDIDEACYANRAACNLELRNYRRAITDCKSALQLNPSNTKAWYRSAKALLSLDKPSEALQCLANGLGLDPTNAALTALRERIMARQEHLSSVEKARKEREEWKVAAEKTLKVALRARGIQVFKTEQPPEMEDAEIRLEDRLDAASRLFFPAIFLYPLVGQTDLVKDFAEDGAVGALLDLVLGEPPQWDFGRAYSTGKVEVFMETKTGGLVKVGKKVTLLSVLNNGRVVVADGLVKLLVVPKNEVAGFTEDWKKKMV